MAMRVKRHKTTTMWLALLVMGALILVGGVGSVDAQRGWPSGITIGASSQGTSSYAIGAAMAQVINKYTNIPATPLATGYGANIVLVAMGEAHLGMVWPYSTQLALRKQGEFADIPVDANKLRLLGPGQVFEVAIATLANSNVRHVSELKGRRLLVDRPISLDTEEATKVLLWAAGIDDGDYQNLQYEGPGDAVPALVEGTADGWGFWMDVNAAWMQEMGQQHGVRFPTLTEEEQKRAVESVSWVFPATIPAGAVRGHDHDALVLAARAMLVANADLPEDLVYEIMKALYDNQEELASFHPRAAEWADLEVGAEMYGIIPYHEGAVRYYKERGKWSDAAEEAQKRLLRN